MRAVFIGCVEFSWHLLKVLINSPHIEVCGIVTKNTSDINADFRSLEPLAESARIPCFNASKNEQASMERWIVNLKPDICFCLGWSYILNPDLVKFPPNGTIGYHPTMLPKNRGRHPIIWALALGMEETGSTFFVMDKNADSGDILCQKTVPIYGEDSAATLYNRLINISEKQLRKIVSDLALGKLARLPQNHSLATYWRKRNKFDGQIDWRMPASGIRNLVRALSHPYAGAHCLYKDTEVKIFKVEVEASPLNIEPGRIIELDNNTITVKAGIGAIRILEHDFNQFPEKDTFMP